MRDLVNRWKSFMERELALRASEEEARDAARVLQAGAELGRVEPPEEAVRAAKARLLDRFRSGGKGLLALLLLTGGLLVTGFLSVAAGTAAGPVRVARAPAMVTMGPCARPESHCS
jgi:hypothetical protein